MYKWSPYYRRYRSKWSPYYHRFNTWSPLYNRYRWSPLYNRYRWSPLYNRYRWSPYYYRYLCDRYYNYRYSPLHRKYYFDDLYLDLKNKMDMFKSFLESLPNNRSDFVNHLEIPDDVLKNRPYADVVDDLSSNGSVSSSVCTCEDLRARPRSPLSTNSSISLSRALTDSEIDYEMFRRYQNRRRSDPFREMNEAIKTFPEEYLVSLNHFQTTGTEPVSASEPPARERPLHNENLLRRMEQHFDECQVFTPDNPALLDLMDALDSIDLKTLDLDLI